MDAVLSMLFVVSYSYNKTIEQIYMQPLLNCHLAAFKIINCTKKRPNDNLITVACVFTLYSFIIAI